METGKTKKGKHMPAQQHFCPDCFYLDETLSEMENCTTMMGYLECVLCGKKGGGRTKEQLKKEAEESIKAASLRLRALED